MIKEEFRQIYTYFAVISCSLVILIISQIIRKLQQKFPAKLPNSRLDEKSEEKDNWKDKIIGFWLSFWSKKVVKYVVFIVLLISSIRLHQDIINYHLLTIYFSPFVSLWANNANFLLFLISVLTSIFFIFLVIKWQINHILAGFLLFLSLLSNLVMLIVPNDYFRIITKCPDFMIVLEYWGLKDDKKTYKVFAPFELKPSLAHQVAILENFTNSDQLEFKFIKNASGKTIINSEKITKIKNCLTGFGEKKIIFSN